jgi:rubrerythrin
MTHIYFLFSRFLFLTAAALVLAMPVTILGCRQQEQAEKKQLVTPENLQPAYMRAARLAYTYDLFAKKAEKDYYTNIARMYRAAAKAEAVHAAGHLEQMKALGFTPKLFTPEKVVVGSTMQTLRMALSDEQIESESMYPNLISTSEGEHLNDLAAQLRRYMRSDEQQKKLMQEALNKNGAISRVPFYVCPKCGGLIMSSKNPGCPDCGVKPEEMLKVT